MNRAIPMTDDGLLRRMLAGDVKAFTLLYRRKHPAIYRVALHMSGNAALAEDVTQEVFMTLIRDAKRFDSERGTLTGFLFGIARNHVRKRWDQDRRCVPLPEECGETGSSGFQTVGGRGIGGFASPANGRHSGNGVFSTAPNAQHQFEIVDHAGGGVHR